MSRSNRTFAGLVGLAAALAAIAAFLPQGDVIPAGELPVSPPVLALVNSLSILVIYGGLGFVGLMATRSLGWPDVWVPSQGRRNRWLVPAVLGIGLGLLFIVLDRFLSATHALGPLPHPPFPTSVVASGVAAISEEVLYRLFLIPGGVWLLTRMIRSPLHRGRIFWVVTAFSALAFAGGHIPSLTILYGTEVAALPTTLLAEIVLLNGLLSLVAAHQLRAHGLLAAIGVHWWTDVVWHVIWGLTP